MSTDTKQRYCRTELWGGIECTINRVGDSFRDQLQYTGHYTRPGDVAQFAALGIRKLRYPVLWEYHQPVAGQPIDWSWTEQQLNSIRSYGIDPVAGLVHHGSGPVYTNLLDKDFPNKLAAYAAAVAIKFPWLTHYTPVNEPLTTARFSGLYGCWYPHHKNERSFIQMLVNQLKGVVQAMQAIRAIQPGARLVQTEDLSKTHSTPLLAYQACFENERRWLTYDLLCGKVDPDHYFWQYFISLGIAETDLIFFLEHPCPPDVMGFNYYVTSERFLDEHIEHYPAYTHGRNGTHIYADTEAVRVSRAGGLKALLSEAWQRYGLPMAVTECHLNCTREEQLRWFKETWDTCTKLNSQGIPVKAVTAWSLLGAYDWNSLLTRCAGQYEPGVFDSSHGWLRPTALAKMIGSLSAKCRYSHPVLYEKGWWHRHSLSAAMPTKKRRRKIPLLIIGSSGTLGHAFVKACEQRAIPFIALSRKDLDILQETAIQQVIDQYRPWAIINAAGYVRVDDAETDNDQCFAVNATAPGLLARLCRQHGIRFMTFSSDLVFDGDKKAPYHEGDSTRPLNVYGASKAEGERTVQESNPQSLIIRTSAFFGPWDQYNFVYATLDALKNERTFPVPADVIVSPTYVPDLVCTAMDLFIDEEEGIWHLSNEGRLTWADFAIAIAEKGGYKKNKLAPRPLKEMGWKARRPLYSALQSEKGIRLPALDHALQRYFEHRLVNISV